ncbi:uncharacterized protein LOC119839097 isoform X2 [Zerene cesonia]|uniref:uncharacterized protein LOC119839097 isoform X2 n=1 Tax=Zerene cesonia TaxID=33412 RepID=UPI0018E4E1CC|nr:uncharacterized protein LOC119839097 isoform X2 [Zerene cesonia]
MNLSISIVYIVPEMKKLNRRSFHVRLCMAANLPHGSHWLSRSRFVSRYRHFHPIQVTSRSPSMNTVDIEKFIECVKGYPILYNRRHKFYNSIAKKTLAWELVGKEMNESSDVLRVKWKGLKDGYTKYKRFQAGVAPSNKSYHSWCWSENLKFLDEYVINKNNSKYKNAQTSETSSPSPPRQSPTPSADDNDLRENIESAQWTVSPAIQYESYSSRRSLSVTDEEYDPKRQKVLDPVDHLFTSYAGTFRKFSLKTQCMIKVKMAKIFADAELAEFESVHTNVSEVLLNVSNDNSIDSSQFTKIKIEKADL